MSTTVVATAAVAACEGRRGRRPNDCECQCCDSAQLDAAIPPRAHCHHLSRVREVVESKELAGCCSEPRWSQSIRQPSYVATPAPDLGIRPQLLVKNEKIAVFASIYG
jgi:hypothetical protein